MKTTVKSARLCSNELVEVQESPPTHRPSATKRCWTPLRALVLACSLAVLGISPCLSAQVLHVASDGAANNSGLLAYEIIDKDLKHICLVKCGSSDVSLLFVKTVTNGVVLPPICLKNCVLTVDMEGRVTKYAVDGRVEFSKKVLPAGEFSRICGRWDDRVIYLTAMSPGRDGPQYRLLWFDVGGSEPVSKGAVAISSPLKIYRVENDIVVNGTEKTERIPAPKAIAREL